MKKMIGNRWLKALYFGTGANLSFFIHDLAFFLDTGIAEADLLISGVPTGVGALTITGTEIYDRYYREPMEDLGLDMDEDFSTDADYECGFCGDPVKKGDRILKDGKTYCTREHVEADKDGN